MMTARSQAGGVPPHREMDGDAGARRRSVSLSFRSRAASAATQASSVGNQGCPARPQPAGRPPVPAIVGLQGVPLREPRPTGAATSARPPSHPCHPQPTCEVLPSCRCRRVGRWSHNRIELDWNPTEHHIYGAIGIS